MVFSSCFENNKEIVQVVFEDSQSTHIMDLIGIKMSQCAWLEKALRLFISLCLAVPQSVVRASNGADPICIQSLAEP